MIRIYPDTKIYILCPAAYVTGGPELLHQLGYWLRQRGMDAYLYYIPNHLEHPVAAAYQAYGVPFVREIEDQETHVLITSETYQHIKQAARFHAIRKYIWWLSVDNFFISRDICDPRKKAVIYAHKTADLIISRLGGNHYYDIAKRTLAQYRGFLYLDDTLLKDFKGHLTQSAYARETLLRIGIPGQITADLSDYLNDHYLNDGDKTAASPKEDIVLYYPRKGIVFTQRILQMADGIRFVPIQGLTKEQTKELLCKAKVYIDFGNHQGKDRVPREAAICRCCVITGRRGAADNPTDIPIPEKYKFQETQTEDILKAVRDCLEHYSQRIEDFAAYRETIRKEKAVFLQQIDNVFNTL